MRNPIIYFFVITNIAITLGTPQTKAQENCKITYQKANSFGIFQQYACPVNGGPIISDETPQFLSLNGEKLIKDFDINCSSKKMIAYLYALSESGEILL